MKFVNILLILFAVKGVFLVRSNVLWQTVAVVRDPWIILLYKRSREGKSLARLYVQVIASAWLAI